MARQLRDGFALEAFDGRVRAPRRLQQFLALYVGHFAPQHRTDTNQLLHYLEEPLPGRRIVYFGLTYEGEPAGFCVLMHYPDEAISVFDFMVIAPTRRGNGAFFAFTNLISEYMERKLLIPNYLIAEVVLGDGELTHGITPATLSRLLRLLGFRVAKLPYKAPDPCLVADAVACKALLMLAVQPDRQRISAQELIRIVEVIYLNHYLLWFRGVMPEDEGKAYEAALRAELERFCKIARQAEVIDLDGNKDSGGSIQPQTERREISILMLGVAATGVSVAVGLRQEPKIGLSVLAVATVAFAAAMFRRRFRRLLLSAFGRGV
ncbi:MAG TPA: hypothetical protein VJU82_08085 [Acidobacteriaceae bacterium]|nr:hypothetical protein [Acidobacteriaceae bacterium]